jgi:hypothetical protein
MRIVDLRKKIDQGLDDLFSELNKTIFWEYREEEPDNDSCLEDKVLIGQHIAVTVYGQEVDPIKKHIKQVESLFNLYFGDTTFSHKKFIQEDEFYSDRTEYIFHLDTDERNKKLREDVELEKKGMVRCGDCETIIPFDEAIEVSCTNQMICSSCFG